MRIMRYVPMLETMCLISVNYEVPKLLEAEPTILPSMGSLDE